MDVTRAIQVGVAWADIVACAIIQHIPTFIIALTVGALVGRWLYTCFCR